MLINGVGDIGLTLIYCTKASYIYKLVKVGVITTQKNVGLDRNNPHPHNNTIVSPEYEGEGNRGEDMGRWRRERCLTLSYACA